MHNGKKVGIALSGGGYRAAAFHLGTLKTLYRLGVLPLVDVISSVSGGSIIAADYLLHQDDFNLFEATFKEKLKSSAMCWVYVEIAVLFIVSIMLSFVSLWSLLAFFLLFIVCTYYILPVSNLTIIGYKRVFFGNARMGDLPKRPYLSINSTDTEFGKPFVFTRDRIIHSEYQRMDGKQVFSAPIVPVAKAVMASSCIPLFNPVEIGKKYQKEKLGKNVYLMDGGLFDNEGIHRLVNSKGKGHADICIISNAGNTRWDSNGITNMFSSLYKGINIMMKRTQSMQNQQMMYMGFDGRHRFAFFELDWDNSDRAFYCFVDYLSKNRLPQELIKFHNLDKNDIAALRAKDEQSRDEATVRIIKTLQNNVDWTSIKERMPSNNEKTEAMNVKTRLDGLKQTQIEALVKQAEWLTELQVKLYLPDLLNNNG